MRILILGGGGLIGSGLENLLNNDGHTTTVLDTFTGSSLPYAGIQGQTITGNCTSFTTMNRVFATFKPEVVFNFVDASSDMEGYYNFQQEADVFVSSSMNLARCIELHGGVTHVFLGSSGDVYKGGSRRKLKETSPTSILSYTGATKKYVEDMYFLLSETSDTKVVSLRFFQVYGNRYFLNSKYDALSIYIDSLLRGYQIAIAGPKTFIDILNVTDAVSAAYIVFVSSMEGSDFNVVNIGSGKSISLSALYKKVAVKFEDVRKPTFIPAGNHTRSLIADTTLLQGLGWSELGSFDESIDKLIEFRMRVINERPGL